MTVAHSSLSSCFVIPVLWRADWAWGLPLIVLTVVIHVLGLGLIHQRARQSFRRMNARRHPTAVFAVVMGIATLLATGLHATEAIVWAISYQSLGAIPDYTSAMLYSMNAMTSYGHESLLLEHRWQIMGAIEALNGSLLFGLTAAFLFGMIQKVWSLGRKGEGTKD
jgi:hypothetical protein